MLFVLVSSCSTVTEQDLVDLQSSNAIVKKEAIQRISKGQHFSFPVMDSLVNMANEKRAAAILVELLSSGKESKDMELTILKTLGALSKTTEVPVAPLIERLKAKDLRIRAQAIEALGKTRNAKASTPLVKLLEEEKEKYAIIWALGEIEDPGAIPALNRLLASEDDYVRYNASRALAKIRTEEVEGNSGTSNNSNTKGLIDIGKIAFSKYQDMMMIVFQKVAGLKRA